MSQMVLYSGWYKQAQNVSQLLCGVYQLDIKKYYLFISWVSSVRISLSNCNVQCQLYSLFLLTEY